MPLWKRKRICKSHQFLDSMLIFTGVLAMIWYESKKILIFSCSRFQSIRVKSGSIIIHNVDGTSNLALFSCTKNLSKMKKQYQAWVIHLGQLCTLDRCKRSKNEHGGVPHNQKKTRKWLEAKLPGSMFSSFAFIHLAETSFGFLHELREWCFLHMGVSKNRGTPKWMVYNGKPY